MQKHIVIIVSRMNLCCNSVHTRSKQIAQELLKCTYKFLECFHFYLGTLEAELEKYLTVHFCEIFLNNDILFWIFFSRSKQTAAGRIKVITRPFMYSGGSQIKSSTLTAQYLLSWNIGHLGIHTASSDWRLSIRIDTVPASHYPPRLLCIPPNPLLQFSEGGILRVGALWWSLQYY